MTWNILQIIQDLLLTAGELFVFIAIFYFGHVIFDQEKLHRSLQLKKNYKFFEFTIFKFSLFALLTFWFIQVLLQSWGASVSTRIGFESAILRGTTIYNVQIIPMRLILGLLVYSGIQMAWKYALLYYSKSAKYDPEEQSHIIITSLLSYLVIAIALLAGLLVSGVDFTGIAIVAGALSVGIGFGLQNIVNNFVSGIILMVEQSVKPGDRVLIKGYEGYVRKINFRYTRVETLQKEDVIFPNSDLITNPIINFEFDNKLCKIKCGVGVAYGSDLDLVRETLINVALKNPDVLRDPGNKPMVYVTDFAESNIQFELSCVIEDVNKKNIITSDLYLAIVRAFQANNIVMPLPQREVRLIQDP